MVDTDDMLGAVTGLLAVGIMANVAGKALDAFGNKKQKGSNKSKDNKIEW